MMKLKTPIAIITFVLFSNFIAAQTACEKVKETKLIKLIEKKYKLNPIEGAKYVFIDSCKFLVSIGITSTTSKSLSVMNRIASVKARRSVLLLLNNPKITTKSVIQTEQVITDNNTSYIEKYFDSMTEESSGFVNGMENLTAFKSSDGSNYVYVLVQIL